MTDDSTNLTALDFVALAKSLNIATGKNNGMWLTAHKLAKLYKEDDTAYDILLILHGLGYFPYRTAKECRTAIDGNKDGWEDPVDLW